MSLAGGRDVRWNDASTTSRILSRFRPDLRGVERERLPNRLRGNSAEGAFRHPPQNLAMSLKKLERARGFEPPTPTLARLKTARQKRRSAKKPSRITRNRAKTRGHYRSILGPSWP